MNHLSKELAPIEDAAWSEIESEARQTLERSLAARKLVDFEGPHGWQASSLGHGRTEKLGNTRDGVERRLRRSLPYIETRVPFRLAREELESIARGGRAPDLSPAAQAARLAAHAEDNTVFSGLPDAGISGLLELGAPHALEISDDYRDYPRLVATALTWLRQQGVDGPYALALGPRCYEGLTATTNAGGYPLFDLVRELVDGRFVWAPVLDGALVISMRGGDFELHVGQDFDIGYSRHDKETVELYIEESFTFLGHSENAVVPLRYAAPPANAP